MTNIFTKIGRTEIVIALSALAIAAQAGLDAASEGVDWNTGLRAVLTAVVGWLIRANVFSKESVGAILVDAAKEGVATTDAPVVTVSPDAVVVESTAVEGTSDTDTSL